ncbi:MAG TPA: peptidylprolyl isomerase [Actinomycetota bacterium]|jgi:parvulin-like peptidyl-prolyl isomerase|nr:peptidylprolyl isomerase [Actinomycetota bacterium]
MTRFATIVAALLMPLAASCGEMADPAAAVVGDHTVTVGDVADALEEFESSPQFERLAQQGDAAALSRSYEQTYLAQTIRRLVLEPEARERGIEVTDDDVEERIDQIKSDFPTEAAFQEALAEQGYDMETLERLVRDSILEERLRAEVVGGVGPSEDEVLAQYEANPARFTEYRARHILVTSNDRAVEIAEQLKAVPPEDLEDAFDRLARRFSKDPGSAERGGDLGWAAAEGYVEPFADALRELEPGEVSDPVRTEFGFHVIWLEDVRVVRFEEVREQLRAEIAGTAEDEAWERFVMRAYERAGVELNPRYGVIDPVSGQISDPPPGSRPGAATPEPEPTPTGIPEPAG